MTDHSKKELSLTLLENSRITGVVLKNLSADLATKGHGLYLESLAGDRYVDLRFSSLRPFWGHTHPLTIQNEYDMLKIRPWKDKTWVAGPESTITEFKATLQCALWI